MSETILEVYQASRNSSGVHQVKLRVFNNKVIGFVSSTVHITNTITPPIPLSKLGDSSTEIIGNCYPTRWEAVTAYIKMKRDIIAKAEKAIRLVENIHE